MKFDRNYLLGIIGIILGAGGLFFAITSHLSSRISGLSGMISDALNLLPKCGFDTEKEKRIGEFLLQAQKKLVIDGNYAEAAQLFNSVSSDMWACQPTLEANRTLMLFTAFALLIGFGIIIIVNRYRETHTKSSHES